MEHYLITKWFGTFLCSKKEVLDKRLFPKKVQEIVQRLEEMQQGTILTEEQKIVKAKQVVVQEKRLQSLGTYKKQDPVFQKLEIKAESYGFSLDLLRQATLLLSNHQIKEFISSPDLQIIQMVHALDDLLQTANLFSERLERWNVIPTADEKKQPFEELVILIDNEMHRLEYLIEEDMKTIAPNIASLVGPLIGARLLASAGSLKKLAQMPASTIQILGAEKALFRYKKEGGKPPKHGIIFQHAFINRAPKSLRGKIARSMAAKLATAAKADAFTKRDIADLLIKELNARLQEIKKR